MRRLLLTCLLLLVAACASSSRPAVLLLTLAIADDANPDVSGRPSPVVVSIFHLTDDERFRHTDYLQLLSAPTTVLRDNLRSMHRLAAIAPGALHRFESSADPAASHVCFVAELMQYADVRTSTCVAVSAGHRMAVALTVDASGIKAVATPRTSLRRFAAVAGE